MNWEEEKALNERVALALGWKKMRVGWWIAPATSRWRGGQGGPVDFISNPAAADEVRLEAERRDWEWAMGREDSLCPGRGWWASVEVPGTPGNDDVRITESSSLSPWHALCLAFLATCEAQAAEAPETE